MCGFMSSEDLCQWYHLHPLLPWLHHGMCRAPPLCESHQWLPGMQLCSAGWAGRTGMCGSPYMELFGANHVCSKYGSDPSTLVIPPVINGVWLVHISLNYSPVSFSKVCEWSYFCPSRDLMFGVLNMLMYLILINVRPYLCSCLTSNVQHGAWEIKC